MINNHLLSGVAEGFEPFIIQEWWKNVPQDILFIAHSDEKAELIYQQLKILLPHAPLLFFPAWDCLPYDRVSPHSDVIAQRLKCLQALQEKTGNPFILTLQYMPFYKKFPHALA